MKGNDASAEEAYPTDQSDFNEAEEPQVMQLSPEEVKETELGEEPLIAMA